ncbi:MAG: hypothetical protein HKP58_01045 [Desulfatitalea sp.]|nr:hypothetical protein [Desulfatitalea sp.]NNJ98972.1 hypothetical protein [Desulfatitalea sp.]
MFDGFIRIKDIPGESTDQKHADWMEIQFATSADGDFPQDEVTFAYDKIEWHYTKQKREGGGPSGNVATGWHLAKNCKA